MQGRAIAWFWPVLVALTLAAGVVARTQALSAGFLNDDYAQRAMLHGAFPVKRAVWDLFDFVDGSAADTQRLIGTGYLPWWTHPGFKLRMLRPLPSLLVALDDQLFAGNARSQHLHSLLWWALMVIAAAGLLATALPRAPAAIALVLFALDDSHSAPLLWLANRNALCAMAFACAGLWAHLLWRRGSRSARVLSVAAFVLALASGEYGLTMVGYLVCLELFSSSSAGPSRLRALMPVIAACVVYLALSVGLGYGAAHSGTYTNPLTDPRGYLGKLLSGIPVLVGDLVWGNSADLWMFRREPDFRALLVKIGALGLVSACALAVWLGTRRDRQYWLAVRWLAAGSALALLPVLGSFLSGRLAMPASLGFFAFLGSAVAYAARGARRSARPVLASIAAAVLICGVLGLDVVRAITDGRAVLSVYHHGVRSLMGFALSLQMDDAKSASQRVVLFATREPEASAYYPFVRLSQGHPLPKAFWLLSGANTALLLTRIDARTLDLHVQGSADALQLSIVGSHTRGLSDRLDTGTEVDVPGMHVKVLGTRAGQPAWMRFRFDVPLEDPSLIFVQAEQTGLRRVSLPPPGESLGLPPPAIANIDTVVVLTPPRGP